MKLYLHICKSADRSPSWIPALGRALKVYCLLRYPGEICSFLSIYLSLSVQCGSRSIRMRICYSLGL